MSDIDDIIADGGDDEAGDFDLLEHLQRKDMRTSNVTIFYSEKHGEQYQQINSALSMLEVAVNAAAENGDDALLRKARRDFNTQSKKAEVFKADLLKHTATFHLRAVPEIITKDARRRARKALGLTKKGEESDELNERFIYEVAASQVQSLVDNRTGKVKTDITADYLIDLANYMPPAQWSRLLAEVNDLQLRNVFAGVKVDNVDFSQGI